MEGGYKYEDFHIIKCETSNQISLPIQYLQ